MPRIAILTFGMLKKSVEHPDMQGFVSRNDSNFSAAEKSNGFIARSGYEGDPGPNSWGTQVYPRFFTNEYGDDDTPSNLSLWEDLESLMAFVYSGVHSEALSQRHQWFQKGSWPGYVLWWVNDDHIPYWSEGVERLEHLHDHGTSAYAFNFKQTFNWEGNEIVLDREAIKAKTRNLD